ncbi:hypothetical protein AeRB84_007605 [Aphanomyces euteiches]|nr:hypothetical protein AeRB84_007605 [Aphanomyces euteiches]
MVQVKSQTRKPTGIPPYVEVYTHLGRNRESIEQIPDIILHRIEKLLDNYGLACGQLSKSVLESTLTHVLQNMGFQTNHNMSPTRQQNEPIRRHAEVFTWGGAFHAVPRGFSFPLVDASAAWQLWWLGNAQAALPPFRFIKPADLESKKQRRLLSEWKFAMTQFHKQLEIRTGRTMPTQPTEEDTAQAFHHVLEYILEVSQVGLHKRMRRVPQLKLVSIIRDVRRAVAMQNQ